MSRKRKQESSSDLERNHVKRQDILVYIVGAYLLTSDLVEEHHLDDVEVMTWVCLVLRSQGDWHTKTEIFGMICAHNKLVNAPMMARVCSIGQYDVFYMNGVHF